MKKLQKIFEITRKILSARLGLGMLSLFLYIVILAKVRSEDIGLWDESDYLLAGIKNIKVGIEYSPVYALFYAAIHALISNPINDYYYGRALAGLLFTISASFLLFQYTRNRAVTISFALFISTSLLAYPWPSVTIFATSMLFIGQALCIKGKNRTILPLIFFLLAAGSRPEYFFVPIIFLAWRTCVVIKNRESNKQRPIGILVSSLLVICFFMHFGTPHSNARLWEAYIGNDALQQSLINPHIGDPWHVYHELARSRYGSDHSIIQAVANHPYLVWKHVWWNLKSIPDWVRGTIFPPSLIWKGLTLISLLPVAHSFLVIGRKRKNYRVSGKNVASGSPLLYSWLILAGTNIVLFPQAHYLSPLLVTSIILTSFILFDSPKASSPASQIKRKVMVSNSLILFTAVALSVHGLVSSKPNNMFPFKDAIQYLQGLQQVNSLQILDSDNGYCAYLKVKCTEFDTSAIVNSNLKTFILRNNINIIVDNGRLENNLSALGINALLKNWVARQRDYGKKIISPGFNIIHFHGSDA